MSVDGDHLGERISALLDDELSLAERRAAHEHLRGCALCRADLDATADVRATVRALPLLDPPFGVIERVLLGQGVAAAAREGRVARRRRPVWLAGAAAAVAVGVLGLAPHRAQPVQPPVARFVDAHATATPGADPLSGLAPVAVPVSFRP